jgi:hypothetical protein
MRKEKKYNYIYKTTNLLNEEYYYGMHSTNNLEDGYIGSGTRLKRCIKKYGIENFKVDLLYFFSDRESLIQKEIEIVNEDILKDSKCLNLMKGGKGGFVSEESQRNRSIAATKKRQYKMENDEEFRKNMSEKISMGVKLAYKDGKIGRNLKLTFLGKKHSDYTKNKIGKINSINQMGEKNSQFGTCWITNGDVNKKIQKSDLEKYSDWKLGRYMKQ